jgi:hypothetical protein
VTRHQHAEARYARVMPEVGGDDGVLGGSVVESEVGEEREREKDKNAEDFGVGESDSGLWEEGT